MTDEQKRVADILTGRQPLPSTRQDLEGPICALKNDFRYAPARRLLLKVEAVVDRAGGFTDKDAVSPQVDGRLEMTPTAVKRSHPDR